MPLYFRQRILPHAPCGDASELTVECRQTEEPSQTSNHQHPSHVGRTKRKVRHVRRSHVYRAQDTSQAHAHENDLSDRVVSFEPFWNPYSELRASYLHRMHRRAFVLIFQQPCRCRHTRAKALSRQHEHPRLVPLPPALKRALRRLLLMMRLPRPLLLSVRFAHVENSRSCTKTNALLLDQQETEQEKTANRRPNNQSCSVAYVRLRSQCSATVTLKRAAADEKPLLRKSVGAHRARRTQAFYPALNLLQAEPVTAQMLEIDTAG